MPWEGGRTSSDGLRSSRLLTTPEAGLRSSDVRLWVTALRRAGNTAFLSFGDIGVGSNIQSGCGHGLLVLVGDVFDLLVKATDSTMVRFFEDLRE